MSAVAPELLMRYADDEVSPTERRFLEVKLSSDQEASDLVAMFRDQRAHLQVALADKDDDAILGRFQHAMDSAFAERHRRRRHADIRRWAVPIAASLLIALMGSALSLHLADRKVEAQMAEFFANQASDRDLAMQTRAEALERMISGRSLTWGNEISGTKGSITPLRTFRMSNGVWCREYQEITVSPTTTEEGSLRIACREGDGTWRPPLEGFRGI